MGRSTLSQYEKGHVWSPDAVVLRELARIYRADVNGLLAVLKSNRLDPALTVEDALASYARESAIAVLTPFEARAWEHANDQHRLAALAVLRLGRNGGPVKGKYPEVSIGTRRLIDFIYHNNNQAQGE